VRKGVLRRRVAVLALIACGPAIGAEPAAAEDQPAEAPRPESVVPRPGPPAAPLGTEQSPIVVRVVPPQSTGTDTARETQEKGERLDFDHRLVELSGDLARYAGALAALAALQFLALVGQIIFLRRAFREARRGGDAAREAAIARERAFVFALGLNGDPELNRDTNRYGWRFRPTWKNSGATPTRNMAMHTECVVRSSPLPAGFNFNYPTMQTGNSLLPPNAEVFGEIAPTPPIAAVSAQDLVDAQQKLKFIYVWGWARYSDVFPGTPQHITRFCWLVTAVGDPLAFTEKNPGALSFSTSPHVEGNCADEECQG
jgi:hypothetical protein